MSFATPAFLAAALVLPLGLLAAHLARGRRRRYAVRFPAATTLAAVGSGAPAWRRWLPSALLALAALALVLALAHPEHSVAVPVQRASVMLISDASGSMAATDVRPSRLEAARAAAKTFLGRVPKELRVGIVGFSSLPYAVVAPTLDRAQVEATLLDLEAGGGTGTGDAVAAALQAMRARRSIATRPPAAIVLLSDGKATEGRDPVEAARLAGRLRVPVYTVALGTPDGAVEVAPGQFVPTPPDPETLREMSRVSGGEAFTAEDAGALNRVYTRLGRQIGTKSVQRPLTAGFAGAGLVLLLLAAGTGVRWRGWA